MTGTLPDNATIVVSECCIAVQAIAWVDAGGTAPMYDRANGLHMQKVYDKSQLTYDL